jgi:molybdopterin converting factor small subunit
LRIHVKLYGVLRTAANAKELDLHFDGSVSVHELVKELVDMIARPEFETYMIDADMKDPRPNTLILVAGTEIGALNGIETMLEDGDEVVFLPVAHGG